MALKLYISNEEVTFTKLDTRGNQDGYLDVKPGHYVLVIEENKIAVVNTYKKFAHGVYEIEQILQSDDLKDLIANEILQEVSEIPQLETWEPNSPEKGAFVHTSYNHTNRRNDEFVEVGFPPEELATLQFQQTLLGHI